MHHTAILVPDFEASLRFWCDGVGLEQIMDNRYPGDWRTLFNANCETIHSAFLGDPAARRRSGGDPGFRLSMSCDRPCPLPLLAPLPARNSLAQLAVDDHRRAPLTPTMAISIKTAILSRLALQGRRDGTVETAITANIAKSAVLTSGRENMTAVGIGAEARRRLSARRTAEIVAEELRRQIIEGELADGDLLPGQKQLVEQFNVSLVSLREALRILETEGLVSVRRGNRGGAVVHAPAKSSAAYMLGLVLQSDSVRMSDLQQALQELEPSCAALAARRPDRAKTLVPELTKINESMAEHLDDGLRFTEIGREFHHAITRECGNHTMVAVMGSLGALLLSSEQQWEDEAKAKGAYPPLVKRRAMLNTHIKLTEAIAAGDVDRARRLASRHLAETTASFGPSTDELIRAMSPQTLARYRR
jgi:GntR family transcriptional repressor for pyruvate dehydrogenase complex